MKNRSNLKQKENPHLPKQSGYFRLFSANWLMLLLLSFTMWQCKTDEFKGETTGICPEVISTDPADKAVSVVAGKNITATFNENMNPSTINQTTFLVTQGSNPVSGTVSPLAGQTATYSFAPASPLAPFTVYTATMKKGVKDPMNNALQQDYVWSFTTQPLVTILSNPLPGGTTTGAGAYNAGASVTVKAVANAGYVFANWTEAGVVASPNADYTFVLNGNKNLVANFTAQYTVGLSSLPLIGGTTSGAGSFNSGSSVTVTAVPAIGYTFTNWTEGTTVLSALKEYTFPITANRVLVANFAINMYSLNITALNGTVLKAPSQTTYSYGSIVQLTPTANAGYSFISWSGDAVGNTKPLTVIMNSDKNITANFLASQFSVSLSANPLAGGTTNGGGSFNSGASVSVSAVPAIGYTFTNI